MPASETAAAAIEAIPVRAAWTTRRPPPRPSATEPSPGAVLITRQSDGGLDFQVLTVGALSADRAQLLQVGAFAVGILDWTASQPPSTRPFVAPSFDVVDAGAVGGGGAAGPSIDTAEYASRRIVGIVFVVLSFLTLVFYGLWVAAGVVAEKANRVMELLISAATAPQLVIGKIVGIGLAGLTQVLLVLAPALAALLASGEIGNAAAGPGSRPAARPSPGCHPGSCSRSSCTSCSASRCTRPCTPAPARC